MDLNAKEEELFSFLKEKYKSLESCKIIYDSYNNISKDFNEYNLILKNNEKLIFKGNELIIK